MIFCSMIAVKYDFVFIIYKLAKIVKSILLWNSHSIRFTNFGYSEPSLHENEKYTKNTQHSYSI